MNKVCDVCKGQLCPKCVGGYTDDSWKDEVGGFWDGKMFRTVREIEAAGGYIDWDGSEFREIMSKVTFDGSCFESKSDVGIFRKIMRFVKRLVGR